MDSSLASGYLEVSSSVGSSVGTLANPSATVQIVPSATSIGPVDYVVTMPAASDSGRIDRSLSGNATGAYDVGTARAGGTVTFFNYTSDSVQVPKGTLVAAGDQAFATNKTINVPATGFFFAGRKSVDVTATSAGTGGNVAAHAINRVVDRALDDRLSSGFPQRRWAGSSGPTTW